MHTTSPPQHKG